MTERKIMPERFSTLDPNMSLEKIIWAKENKEPITGQIILWRSDENLFEVYLGNGFIATLPIDEASLYPALHPNGDLTSSLLHLVGNNIIAAVTSVDIDNATPTIILSRKETMSYAFDIISNSINDTVECCITGIASFGIFVDVGNGISGMINYRELTLPRIHHCSELGFNVGEKITAKILAVNENSQVDLSYKDLFKNLAFELNYGDLVIVTLLERLNNDGIFGYLNPNTPVLIDLPEGICCNYGDKVLARVKNPKKHHPDKLNLVFVSFTK